MRPKRTNKCIVARKHSAKSGLKLVGTQKSSNEPALSLFLKLPSLIPQKVLPVAMPPHTFKECPKETRRSHAIYWNPLKKRSNTTDGAFFDQELCVFCQQRDNTDIHNVTTEGMGKMFLSIKVSSRNVDIRQSFPSFMIRKTPLLKI